MCLAWTRRGRSDLGLPTGVPNAWRKALVRDYSGEGALLAFEVGDGMGLGIGWDCWVNTWSGGRRRAGDGVVTCSSKMAFNGWVG